MPLTEDQALNLLSTIYTPDPAQAGLYTVAVSAPIVNFNTICEQLVQDTKDSQALASFLQKNGITDLSHADTKVLRTLVKALVAFDSEDPNKSRIKIMDWGMPGFKDGLQKRGFNS